MWCVSRLLWSAGAGRFLFFDVGVKVRGGSVLYALCEVLAVLCPRIVLRFWWACRLDVLLDLFPFNNIIIYHCTMIVNRNIVQ